MTQDYRTRFQLVVDAALAGATVLTSNTRSARCVLTACERRMLSQNKKVWATPTVLPLSAWMQQVWREAQARGAAEKVLLRSVQELQFWEQIIERTGGMGELLRPSSAAPEALQAWRLLHGYRISRTASAFAVTRQTREFLGWCNAFESLCGERGFIDGAVLADQVTALFGREPGCAPRRVVVWGFDEITPQQRELFASLRALGVECEELEGSVVGSGVTVRVTLADAEQEIVTAARWARAQLERAPEKRVGVVVPGLFGVRAMVERIFLRELNPEFFAGAGGTRAFDISLGLQLDSYSVIRTAVLALRLATESLSFPELRELLTSAYIAGAEHEGSARARLVAKLSEELPERVPLSALLNRMGHGKSRELVCPQLRGLLREFAAKCSAIPARARYGEWARIAHGLLAAVGWPGESQSRVLNSVEYQAVEKWREVLSEVASLELTSPVCDLRRAFASILSGASSTVFAPENRAAAVQILGEAEAAGSVFDALWVCGLTDEAWPPRRRANPFIPASLQQRAGVPGSAPELGVASARAVLGRLVASAGEVVLSSPMSDGDRELRPCSLIAEWPAADAATLEPSRVPLWEELPSAECESLEDNTAPAVKPEDLLHHGTSVIDRQSNCPFRAFAELRLQAKKIEDPPAGIRTTERGKVIENALERVWKALRDQHTLQNTADGELQTIIATAVDDAVDEEVAETGDPLRVRLRAIERERLIRLVNEWLEVERRRDRFDVLDHQREVKFTIGGIAMRGFIDRIDRVGDGFVVLDYKAGENYRPSQWKPPRPQSPQLPLYAVALKKEGKEVAALSFAKVVSGECQLAGMTVRPQILAKTVNVLQRQTEGRTLPEQLELWEQEFSKLAAEHLAGRAEVDPKNPPKTSGTRNTSCAYCPLDALCRVAELDLIEDSDGGDDEQR